jgi:hypothetical protein
VPTQTFTGTLAHAGSPDKGDQGPPRSSSCCGNGCVQELMGPVPSRNVLEDVLVNTAR